MYKVIIFDYGGVLGSDADEWNTTFKVIKKATGLSANTLQTIFEAHWPKLKIGQEELIKYWIEVAMLSKNKITAQKLEKIYLKNVTVNQKVLSLVRSLKDRGYPLYILANESKEAMAAKSKKFKLDKIFKKIYYSADMGIGKPDRKAFKYVLNNLKIKPDEIIFIDNQNNNIKTAQNLKIKSILFKNLYQLQKELKLLLPNQN